MKRSDVFCLQDFGLALCLSFWCTRSEWGRRELEGGTETVLSRKSVVEENQNIWVRWSYNFYLIQAHENQWFFWFVFWTGDLVDYNEPWKLMETYSNYFSKLVDEYWAKLDKTFFSEFSSPHLNFCKSTCISCYLNINVN